MLKCESCGNETEGRDCLECEKTNPEDAFYCCYCGKSLESSTDETRASGSREGDPYDLDNRILCPDDACIGIIDENGVCTECGRRLEE